LGFKETWISIFLVPVSYWSPFPIVFNPELTLHLNDIKHPILDRPFHPRMEGVKKPLYFFFRGRSFRYVWLPSEQIQKESNETKTRQYKKQRIQSQFTYKKKKIVQPRMMGFGLFFVIKSVHTTIEPQLTTEDPLPSKPNLHAFYAHRPEITNRVATGKFQENALKKVKHSQF